jgi:hypothetical protein
MKISQREARRLRKRVNELELRDIQRCSRYSSEYPGGTHIARLDGMPDFTDGRIDAATKLGFALVAKWDEHQKVLQLYAVKP